MGLRDGNVAEGVPFLDEERAPREQMSISLEDEKPWTGPNRFRMPEWRIRVGKLPCPRFSTETRHHALDLSLRIVKWFIPSFVRRSPESSSKQLHETAYLDGMRGYACYAVFFSHHFTAFCWEVWHPFGEGPNLHFVQTSHFFQLPIIRLLFQGQAAITVFFVMSGYVLSYKSWKLIHANEYEKLQACLTSSIFRRWLRLFLPVIALWIVNVFLVEFGVFEWFDAFKVDNPGMPPGMTETYLERGDSFWGTAYNAYLDFNQFARYIFFRWTGTGALPQVDGHTWTLQVEFRSSCILFLFLEGTSRMETYLRLAFFISSTWICLYWDQWAIATFLAGSVIADLDLRMRRAQKVQVENPASQAQGWDSLPHASEAWKAKAQSWFRANWDQIAYGFTFFCGLILLSYPPTGAHEIWLYSTLQDWKPHLAYDLFFYLSIGAMLVVFSAGRFRPLTRLLSHPFSQYIGKTSFALYLVHGTVIKSMGYFTVIHTWTNYTGYEGWGYAFGIIIPLVFAVGPTVVICTDWFWRGIDIPSVRFARWIESSCGKKVS